MPAPVLPSPSTGAPESDELTLLPLAVAQAEDPRQAATLLSLEPETTSSRATVGALGTRYTDLGLLGAGGMGQVRRVRDELLDRTVAMKLIRPERVSASLDERFAAEARLVARLQHPGIVPLYDFGALDDGRRFITMREVHGLTLASAIQALHRASPERWGESPEGWTLHRLVDAFASVCRTVAYAHSCGVLHRDLKPSNVMLGEHGEVLVLDWGLGKLREEAGALPVSANETVAGAVLGTPSYMAPEQAQGEELTPRADVYGLGATLYELLFGAPPYRGSAEDVLRALRQREPPPFAGAGPAPPPELVALCRQALALAPEDRPASPADLARVALGWLDGVGRRAEAQALLEEAGSLRARAGALRELASARRAAAAALLNGVQSWEPEARKAPGWALEDEARAHEIAAGAQDVGADHALHTAASRDPGLEEAHVALVERYQELFSRAEGAQDEAARHSAELNLQAHAVALPPARREALARWLRGDGALTLRTDPPGAEVLLEHYKLHNRRLVPEPLGSLGRTPLEAVPLPMGSYRLRLRAEGRAEVLYPVHIGREEHWDGVPPGERESQPVYLPRADELGPDDCYVPAGWFWSGGDPKAVYGRPEKRAWVDGFVLQRFPITNRQFIQFLDQLLERGDERLALELCPRERPARAGELGGMCYGRDAQGHFTLATDGQGDLWLPEYPAVMLSWYAAVAYGAWLQREDGRPWRLPLALEWEKAARGVDRRYFPWGNTIDPSWAWVMESQRGRPVPNVIDSCPIDEGVYGVRGLGGNVRDWCQDPCTPTLGDVASSTMSESTDPEERFRLVKGGLWAGLSSFARSAAHAVGEASSGAYFLGFRLARSLP